MLTLFNKHMQKYIKVTFAIVLVFCAALECSAKECKKEQAKAERFFRMAQEQAGKNRVARAKFLKKALKVLDKCELFDNTQKIKILLSLGQLEYGDGKQKAGAALFERAVSLERMAEFPNSFTFVAMGDAFSGLPKPTTAQLDKAASAYEEALEINSFSSETLKSKTMSRLRVVKNLN